MSKELDYDSLMMIFNSQGHVIQAADKQVIGKGVFETVLEEQGFTKKELRHLIECSVLKKVTTRWKGGWRNTYVLPLPQGFEFKPTSPPEQETN